MIVMHPSVLSFAMRHAQTNEHITEGSIVSYQPSNERNLHVRQHDLLWGGFIE
jgi:hypothetical protein